jgi:hypothetical protein
MRVVVPPQQAVGTRQRDVVDRDRVLLFRDLATLRDDIPLFGSVDELKWPGPTPAFQPLAARLEAAVADPRKRELPRKRSV